MRFPQLLACSLEEVGKPASALATRTGYKPSQIAAWLAGSRPIGLDGIGRVGHALADFYETAFEARSQQRSGTDLVADAPSEHQPRRRRTRRAIATAGQVGLSGLRYRGRMDLVALLCELAESAGFRVGDGHRDVVGPRLFGNAGTRTLRVGWYEKYPLAYSQNGLFQGIAKVVTERVAALIAAQVEWVYADLIDITGMLMCGDIDMICCEYIGAESIMFDIWLSDCLPGLRVAPVGLIHGDNQEQVTTTRFDTHSRVRACGPRFERLLYSHSDTLIGQSLFSCLASPQDEISVNLESTVSDSSPAPIRRTLQECYAHVLEQPCADRDLFRCFATDSLTFIEAKRSYPNEAALLPPTPFDAVPEFGLCFALHPSEGSRLGLMLNRAMQKLAQMGYLASTAGVFECPAYRPWRDVLMQNEALVASIRSRQTAQTGSTPRLEVEFKHLLNHASISAERDGSRVVSNDPFTRSAERAPL